MSVLQALVADSSGSIFDLITGLPVHPLIAHFAVVLLPLAATGLLVALVLPSFRKRFGILMVLGVLGGAVAAFIASQSGEQLAKRVGEPREHAELGELLPYVGIGLALVAAAWFYLASRADNESATPIANQGVLTNIAAGVSFILAFAAIVGTTIVGHSGAAAVWERRVNPQPAPSSSSTPTDDPYALSLEEIGAHASKSDCWTSIDAIVYDLTPWLATNTADTSVICGGISTAANVGATELAAYEIGTLDTTASGPSFTAAEVSTHSSKSDCWSIVNGRVYELTEWISQHPGGEAVVEAMCGNDSTAAFNGQHAGAQTANETIAGYEIGVLK